MTIWDQIALAITLTLVVALLAFWWRWFSAETRRLP
jgi:hypothetical protein